MRYSLDARSLRAQHRYHGPRHCGLLLPCHLLPIAPFVIERVGKRAVLLLPHALSSLALIALPFCECIVSQREAYRVSLAYANIVCASYGMLMSALYLDFIELGRSKHR